MFQDITKILVRALIDDCMNDIHEKTFEYYERAKKGEGWFNFSFEKVIIPDSDGDCRIIITVERKLSMRDDFDEE